MAGNVTVRLSAAAAAFVGTGAGKQEKLRAARGEVPLCVADLANLLLFLSLDADPEVKTSAVKSLREMPGDLLEVIAHTPEIHPKVLEVLARFHPEMPVRRDPPGAGLEPRPVSSPLEPAPDIPDAEEPPEDLQEQAAEPGEEEDPGAIDEESEKFLSKYKLAMQMSIADKIKIALTGDKEWRSILTKDSNKLVSSAVIKNPRITQAEILNISKSKIQNDDILRLICMNREWLKNYQIRKALVENNKTPLPKALRFMATLTEKDLGALAKSKNVPTVISTQARRLLMSKNKAG